MVSTAPKSTEKYTDTEATVRLTVAQATIRFLANQYVERDGERSRFFAGCFGIFGHGNVAGMGQALLQAEIEAEGAGTEPALRYVLGRNEQAMVHTAAAYARQKDRLQAWAVTASRWMRCSRNRRRSFSRSRRSEWSRVTFANPTWCPESSYTGLITTLAQKRDPSLRSRQPSSE